MVDLIHQAFVEELDKIAQMGVMNPNAKKAMKPKIPKPFKAKAPKAPKLDMPNAIPGTGSGPVGGAMPGY